eukprot:GHVN01054551.1.p3 GENE.GHVN01054551.1~~GHVN01054551.1.p3  ORF type:complete len:113 (+),score=14.46 GHVN01054551.1:1128-1466(+)
MPRTNAHQRAPRLKQSSFKKSIKKKAVESNEAVESNGWEQDVKVSTRVDGGIVHLVFAQPTNSSIINSVDLAQATLSQTMPPYTSPLPLVPRKLQTKRSPQDRLQRCPDPTA